MRDARLDDLAGVLVAHSLQLTAGESVLIEAIDAPAAMVEALVEAVVAVGAVPIVGLASQPVQRALLRHATEDSMRLTGAVEKARMAAVDAYVGLRAGHNISELSDVPAERMKLYTEHVLKPVHFDLRVKRGRWVVLRYPTSAMAQLAGMSTAGFEDFYFEVCTIDYAALTAAMQPLEDLMNRSDTVRIVAPGTDLRFRIGGIRAILCGGQYNIPDGEVFTAPVRDSLEGTIRFNAPTIYQGTAFDNVALTFAEGRVVEASSSNTKRLVEILDTDEGARYVGEFALGVNPRITRPMRDILFDEKIAGSLHLALGNAYDEADNGNRSQVHWDLVLLQDAGAGGGELWFDDRLVRRDGRFLADELTGLNPSEQA